MRTLFGQSQVPFDTFGALSQRLRQPVTLFQQKGRVGDEASVYLVLIGVHLRTNTQTALEYAPAILARIGPCGVAVLMPGPRRVPRVLARFRSHALPLIKIDQTSPAGFPVGYAPASVRGVGEGVRAFGIRSITAGPHNHGVVKFALIAQARRA